MYKEENYSRKSWVITFLLLIFGGILGLHRFYTGKVKSGILFLITGGCCGIGYIVDFVYLISGRFTDNDGLTVWFKNNDKKNIEVKGINENTYNVFDYQTAQTKVKEGECPIQSVVAQISTEVGQSQKSATKSETDNELLALIESGGKVKAIKYIRERSCLTLSEAKEIVDKLVNEMQSSHRIVLNTEKDVNGNILFQDNYDDINMVDRMEGHEFEHFCADILRKNDFKNVKVTPASGDQGVDNIATKEGIKYAIQCKCYSTTLGNTPIQEVNAGKVFYGCHVGVVLTNSTFTTSAIQLAEATGTLLWDRKKLEELINSSKAVMGKKDAYSLNEEYKKSFVNKPNNEVKEISYEQEDFYNQYFFDNKEILRIDGVQIEVDKDSASRLGVEINNIGLEKDGVDEAEILLDVTTKNTTLLRSDLIVICNAYCGHRKIAMETEYIYKSNFYKKDSCSIYFCKKDICSMADKIEIYCKSNDWT